MGDIAKDWLEKAKAEEDPYNRFMAAYVALNYLYDARDEPSERVRMVKYLGTVYQCDNNAVNMASFDISEYLKCPVVGYDRKHDMYKECKTSVNDISSLFNAIYQVRCNLFHGNKALDYNDGSRDKNLVKQGGDVIIQLLEQALNA